MAARAGTPHAQPPYFDLQFSPVSGHADQLSFSFGPIYAGRTYIPEFCTDLAAGNWQPLTTTSAPVDANGRRTLVDLAASGPRKFYRVKLAGDPTPFRLTAENHWVANSGGRPNTQRPAEIDPIAWDGNAGNHLTGLRVMDWEGGSALVITSNEYDETGLGNRPNLGAVYRDGHCLGKAFDVHGPIDNRTAKVRAGTLTATVRNFWGRGFFLRVGLPEPVPPNTPTPLRLTPPPTGAAAPYVELSDGREIRSVEDPTAVSFDLQGRLWITDNGPDQNVKIFDVTSGGAPILVGTFGEAGGVFSGPVPGAWGEKRFWGPVGIGHDSDGNVYVGSTGMSSLMMGGTDIRAYAADGTFLWMANSTFTNAGDADPASDGTSVHLNAKRYALDYTKGPGASWSFAAVTLDPFRFPDDLRLQNAMESVWVRRIEGRKFLFLGNMYGQFIYVVRFEPGSEIGIPTAYFNLGVSGNNSGVFAGLHPNWEPTENNKNRRWRWLDTSGDGQAQADEFAEFYVGAMAGSCVDVDESGAIWYGGRGEYSSYFRDGGMTRLVPGGLAANGVPRYPLAALERPAVPFAEHGAASMRLKYLPATDTLFISGSYDAWYDRVVYRYDHFSDPARRTRVFAADLGYEDFGRPVHLDQGMNEMTIPHGFTADEDYIYVVYLDNGRDARTRGEVTIYDARDGHKVGWIVPGQETGGYSGAMDLVNPINVVTRANGEKVIIVEENGAGKVMVYRWTPPHMP
ncbi:MAG: hypothetical protein IPL39_23165 [Opitutaceae bacterium]|nr:hypothetical protein [Opitutaceae bacterium]